MAAIGTTQGKTGIHYHIQLAPAENPTRPKIRLGRCKKDDARDARKHILELLKVKRTGGDLKLSTQDWLNSIPDSLRRRLEKLRLFEGRSGSRWTVEAFVADYIKRRADVKDATRRKWRDVQGKLNAFFRGDCLDDVTVQKAKNFRVHLQATAGLSENSIRRQIGIARQFLMRRLMVK